MTPPSTLLQSVLYLHKFIFQRNVICDSPRDALLRPCYKTELSFTSRRKVNGQFSTVLSSMWVLDFEPHLKLFPCRPQSSTENTEDNKTKSFFCPFYPLIGSLCLENPYSVGKVIVRSASWPEILPAQSWFLPVCFHRCLISSVLESFPVQLCSSSPSLPTGIIS